MGTSEDHLSWAHPVVREWFISRFGTPTEPQISGWPHILAQRDTLISAPTGSGKTLAAFLACIDSLVRRSLDGSLRERTQVLYISPLKALGNDVQKNLDQPLFEIQQLAAQRGYLMPGIRTMVRTGDTPPRDRARMLKTPPHILVTTPESLYILLTAARSREILRHIRTVIVDEIHALANNKRGAHLALSLERLEVITHQRPNRIGLSATQRPLSLVAEFLSGNPCAASPHMPSFGICGDEASLPSAAFDLSLPSQNPTGGPFEPSVGLSGKPVSPQPPTHSSTNVDLPSDELDFPATSHRSTHINPVTAGGPHMPSFGICGDEASLPSAAFDLPLPSQNPTGGPFKPSVGLSGKPVSPQPPTHSSTNVDLSSDELDFPATSHRSTHINPVTAGGPHMPSFGICGDEASLPPALALPPYPERSEGSPALPPVTVLIPSTRPLDLAIELPSSELGPIASNEMWDEIYERLEQLALEHRSTLVFVNTRRLVERISHHLSERMGEDQVAAHHGSLSRHLRLESERRLKQGECRILIATASLELGIDIGNVDLVCQIGSPRAIAIALQRVGRAGHWRGAIPKGRFFATTRDELVECAAIIRAIRQSDLDSLVLPDRPLDILAQQIVACCAADEWNEDELFSLVRRARNYRDLSRDSFDKILVMLSEGISAKRGRFGAYLYRDQVNHRLRARRGARLAAITSGGAIPETALLSVVALPEETVIGSLDEDFAIESHAGDIMLLGNTSWRIRRVEAKTGRVLVEDAHGQPPTIPFWRGEAPGRTFELSTHVGTLRQLLSDSSHAVDPDFDLKGHPERSEGPLHCYNLSVGPKLSNQQSILSSSAASTAAGGPHMPSVGICGDQATLPSAAFDLTTLEAANSPVLQVRARSLGDNLGNSTDGSGTPLTFSSTNVDLCSPTHNDLSFLDPESLRQLTAYISEGRTVLGGVPTQRTIIAERFFDEGGGMQLVIHAPFGARINRAWGLALRKRFCRSFNFELQASATDDGINIALAEQHSFPLADVFHFLQPETVEEILQQAVLTGSPIFATRFRWDANRSLALLRFQNGKKVPPQIQRMRSDDLLAAVFPDVAACFENIEGDIKIPDHPLVEEVMKDVMHEAMDIDGLRRVLEGIRDGSIQTIAVDTPVPSQFAHEILNANPYAFLDDAPLEERRARAVQLRRTLPASILEEAGKLDPAAIAQVVEESRPDLRDADDLHDLLQTLILFPTNVDLPSDALDFPATSHRSTHINPVTAGGPHMPSFGICGDEATLPSAAFDLPLPSQNPTGGPHMPSFGICGDEATLPSAAFDLPLPSQNPTGGPFKPSVGLSGKPVSPQPATHSSTNVDLPSDELDFPATSHRSTHINPVTTGGPHMPSFGICGDAASLPSAAFDLPQLTRWMHDLVETRRAVFAFVGDREFWVASEKSQHFASIYVDVSFSPEPPELPLDTPSPETIFDRSLLGWMQHSGPLTSQELSALFTVDGAGNPSPSHITIDGEVTSPSETITQTVNRPHATLAALEASLLRLEATGAILRGHFRSTSGPLEWCDRRLLARIHRLTVATLRKQIEPVTAAQFMHWLLRWQHLTPGTALRGEHGLLEALRQLQGFETPASAWERHILSRRVADYDGAALDHLCLMGAAGWGRLSPHPATLEDAGTRTRRVVPTSVAPITFFLREDCAWMQPRTHDALPEPGLSGSAQLVLDTLRRRGASFFADLLRLTALERLEVERGLWELVAAGFVTADGFDNLRGLISKAHPAANSSRGKRPGRTAGRWSLLWDSNDAPPNDTHNGAQDDTISPGKYAPQTHPTTERIEATCWVLLRRYGIVFRELLTRESNFPKWRELQLAFRRLENRGEVRGGRFVSGFVGEQFALPVAVESVRESRKLPTSNEVITISAADPLNLVGIIVPGERIPAIGFHSVTFRDGVYVPDAPAPALAVLPETSFPYDSPTHEAAV